MADQATFADQAMAVHGFAVLGRAAHDPEPGRRRGPRAGDLPQGVPRVRRLPGGHQPQGLALPDPHQHVHQHRTGPRSAGPTRPTSTRSRTSTSTAVSAASRRPSLGRSAEDELMDFFTDAEVKEAVEALPEQFRMAVLLADVEGFSYKEIAEILDIPIGTVMSRLHRGRKALQKELYEFAVRTRTGRARSRTGDRTMTTPARHSGRTDPRPTRRRRSAVPAWGTEPTDASTTPEHETTDVDCQAALTELYDLPRRRADRRASIAKVAARTSTTALRASRPSTSRPSCGIVIATKCQDAVPDDAACARSSPSTASASTAGDRTTPARPLSRRCRWPIGPGWGAAQPALRSAHASVLAVVWHYWIAVLLVIADHPARHRASVVRYLVKVDLHPVSRRTEPRSLRCTRTLRR